MNITSVLWRRCFDGKRVVTSTITTSRTRSKKRWNTEHFFQQFRSSRASVDPRSLTDPLSWTTSSRRTPTTGRATGTTRTRVRRPRRRYQARVRTVLKARSGFLAELRFEGVKNRTRARVVAEVRLRSRRRLGKRHEAPKATATRCPELF